LNIALIERSLLQEQKYVLFYPLLKMPNGEQDALGLGSSTVPLFAEAIGECLVLLCGLKLCQ